MSFYFKLLTVENNKNKMSVKFQGDMLNFCDFIQVSVLTTNHHLQHSNSCPRSSNIKTVELPSMLIKLWYACEELESNAKCSSFGGILSM